MKFKRWVLYKVYNIKCFPLFYSKMCIYHDEVFLCKEKTFIKAGLFTRPRQIQSHTYTRQIPTSFKKMANSSSTLYIKPDPTVPKQFRKGQNRNFLILFFLSFHFISFFLSRYLRVSFVSFPLAVHDLSFSFLFSSKFVEILLIYSY